jgi:hypothetical protein
MSFRQLLKLFSPGYPARRYLEITPFDSEEKNKSVPTQIDPVTELDLMTPTEYVSCFYLTTEAESVLEFLLCLNQKLENGECPI